jgi:hypothetical protein
MKQKGKGKGNMKDKGKGNYIRRLRVKVNNREG